MKAIWNKEIIAESSDTKIVEDTHYFPKDSIKPEYFKSSKTTTRCAWKGEAYYYDLAVNGKIKKDAAWYFPQTSYAAKPIENYVAFWQEINVIE